MLGIERGDIVASLLKRGVYLQWAPLMVPALIFFLLGVSERAIVVTESNGNGVVNTLRLRMDQMKISPRELGEKIGVTRQRIYQILGGDPPATYDMALEICRVLKCRLSDVFELKENPKKLIVPRKIEKDSDEMRTTLEHFRHRKKVSPLEDS